MVTDTDGFKDIHEVLWGDNGSHTHKPLGIGPSLSGRELCGTKPCGSLLTRRVHYRSLEHRVHTPAEGKKKNRNKRINKYSLFLRVSEKSVFVRKSNKYKNVSNNNLCKGHPVLNWLNSYKNDIPTPHCRMAHRLEESSSPIDIEALQ